MREVDEAPDDQVAGLLVELPDGPLRRTQRLDPADAGEHQADQADDGDRVAAVGDLARRPETARWLQESVDRVDGGLVGGEHEPDDRVGQQGEREDREEGVVGDGRGEPAAEYLVVALAGPARSGRSIGSADGRSRYLRSRY